MSEPLTEVTRLLLAFGHGEAGVLDRLVTKLYDRLRVIARRQLRSRRRQTLETTGLVHELYLKMVDQTRVLARDRGHFYCIAAAGMRQILVDHALRRSRAKRGAGIVHTGVDGNDARMIENHTSDTDLVLAVNQAMKRLGELDPHLPKIVECRFFGGLSMAETAAAVGLSERSAYREWARARAWLKEELAR